MSGQAPAGLDTAGLVAAYDLSSRTPEGHLRDFGPHGLHGAFTRPGSVVPGPLSTARSFTVVADRIDLPEHPAFDMDGPLTVAVWLRVDSLGLHQHVVACDDKWSLWVTPADQLRLGDTRGGGWSTPEHSVPRGRWFSAVAVLDGTRGAPLDGEAGRLYVNGERLAAAAHPRSDEALARGQWSPGELYPTDACHVGFESHQGNPEHQLMPFVGAIDELLIYSRAWSEAEVRAFSRPPSPVGASEPRSRDPTGTAGPAS